MPVSSPMTLTPQQIQQVQQQIQNIANAKAAAAPSSIPPIPLTFGNFSRAKFTISGAEVKFYADGRMKINGQLSTDMDKAKKIIFAAIDEICEVDWPWDKHIANAIPRALKKVCQCGAIKANTTHATWCPSFNP